MLHFVWRSLICVLSVDSDFFHLTLNICTSESIPSDDADQTELRNQYQCSSSLSLSPFTGICSSSENSFNFPSSLNSPPPPHDDGKAFKGLAVDFFFVVIFPRFSTDVVKQLIIPPELFHNPRTSSWQSPPSAVDSSRNKTGKGLRPPPLPLLLL